MKYKVTLRGKTYEIEVEPAEARIVNEYEAPETSAPTAAAPAQTAAPTAAPAMGGEPVVAPMPGTILQVRVQNGVTVKRGDVLVILEAMKMENEIFAPRDGVVNQVTAVKGAAVDTGAVLVVLG